MNIKKIYSLFKKHPIISTDTRSIKQSSIFFALSGENFDGNKFAIDALEKGAAYCIIDNPEYELDERTILVNDSLKTLQQLATYHRQQLNLPIIGITGTNGKTTSKELIKEVLSKKYRVKATAGNFNNHIGVPLTILTIDNDDEIAVIEMGTNHIGEINTLCKIADPDYGIITNIGIAHLEGFINYEGVKKAKNELYDHIRQVKGKIILNLDDSELASLADGIDNMSFGKDFHADIHVLKVAANPFVTLQWNSFNDNNAINNIESNLVGIYNSNNIMTAISTGVLFGVPEKQINEAINNYTPSNMRSQYITTDKNKVLIDAYNANPTSMKAALQNFAAMETANKCIIIGEMKELGMASKQEHNNILQLINSMNFEKIFLVGESFKPFSSKYKVFHNTTELSLYLDTNPLINKTVLLKGSRGNRLEILLDKI